MKILFNFNFKFYEKNSVDMIKMLKEKDIKKNVSGFELCFDIEGEKDKIYAKESVRISKNYLKSILANNIGLAFTYDAGHESIEYGELIDLEGLYIGRIY